MRWFSFTPVPGPVISRADGQRHHIDAGRLVMLYGVRNIMHLGCHELGRFPVGGHEHAFMRVFTSRWPWRIPLTPRYDGDYSVGAAVRRWAPFALTIFRERLSRTEERLAESACRCVALGARISDFEARHPEHAQRIFRARARALVDPRMSVLFPGTDLIFVTSRRIGKTEAARREAAR